MSEEQRIRIKEEILAYAKNSVENNRRMQLNGIWPHLMHNKLGADDSDTLIKDLTMEIVWQLISDGIFSYLEPPWIDTTLKGRNFLSNSDFVIYDPDSYILKLHNLSPLDTITKNYISESIEAFNKNLLMSSTVMLGVAAEHLVLTLIEKYANHEKNIKLKTLLQTNTFYKTILTEFDNALTKCKDKPLKRKIKNFITTFGGTIHFYRYYRNSFGHPSETKPTYRIAYANLSIFIEFYSEIESLIKQLT